VNSEQRKQQHQKMWLDKKHASAVVEATTETEAPAADLKQRATAQTMVVVEKYDRDDSLVSSEGLSSALR
jgi:hypothetical protein